MQRATRCLPLLTLALAAGTGTATAQGPTRSRVRAWLTALQGSDARARSLARRELAAAGRPAALACVPWLQANERSEVVAGAHAIGIAYPAAAKGAENLARELARAPHWNTVIGIAEPPPPRPWSGTTPLSKDRVLGLLEELKSSPPKARRRAAWTLASMREPGEEVERALAAGVGDASASVRRACLDALIQIGAKGPATIAALRRALRDESARMRLLAAKAIGARSPEAASCVPELIGLLGDRAFYVRESAIRALGSFPAQAKRILPAIVPLMDDRWTASRRAAIESVGKMGAAARAVAADLLLRAIGDRDPDIGDAAAQALCRIADRSLTPRLLRESPNSPPARRVRILKVLGQVDGAAPRVLLYMIEAMGDADKDVYRAAKRGVSGYIHWFGLFGPFSNW